MTVEEFQAIRAEDVVIAPNKHHWIVLAKTGTQLKLRRRGGNIMVRSFSELKDWHLVNLEETY